MKRLISILSLMFILVGTISAEGEYGDYDRPSIFPDFEEPTKYPNNMSCMLYVRNINGQYVSNYEVAAYDQNGFLHAVNRSSKSKDTGNDCCVLTISGEEGDTLDFMVIYGDFEQPTKVWAVETLPFETNAEIGRDPLFVLTLSETPSVLYWTGDPTSATPTGSVPLDRIKAGMLKDARRISLKGTWNKRSVSDLLDGCKSLLYVDMESIPDTTAGAFTDSNPNCLKFLPDGTAEAPEGWTNCIADGKALTDINLQDGTQSNPYPFYCPETIDLNGNKATYRRTAGWTYADGKSGWNTLVVPFDAKLYADGDVINPISSLDLSKDKKTWKMESGYWICSFYSSSKDGLEFTNPSVGGIIANTPYLFAMPGHKFRNTISDVTYSLSMEGKDIVFVSNGESIPKTPDVIIDEDEDEDSEDSFVGTYDVILSSPMSILRQGIADGYDAFVYYSKANIMPFRAYITADASTASIRPIRLGWEWTDNPTSITTDRLPVTSQSSPFYDLSGRLTVRPTANGIIINNRKKSVRINK